MSENSLFVHDDHLGHALNPGFSGPGVGRSFHTIDADGLRFTGEMPAPNDGLTGEEPIDQGPILAVGDSYTYGDEVRDEEAWPAQLQRLTGRRVLNGGVTGYGFDQMVLRTEQLVARYRPSVVIASFITHDVQRAEMRRMWWRNKPWFVVENDRLVLKGVPVPKPGMTRVPRHIRGRLDTTLLSLPPILQHVFGYHVRVHRSGFGLEIAKRLVGRLAGLQAEHGIKVILMAQYPPDTWTNHWYLKHQRQLIEALLDCATAHGIATVDTYRRLATEPKPQDFYANAHMNPRGNLAVASLLAVTLPTLVKQSVAKTDG